MKIWTHAKIQSVKTQTNTSKKKKRKINIANPETSVFQPRKNYFGWGVDNGTKECGNYIHDRKHTVIVYLVRIIWLDLFCKWTCLIRPRKLLLISIEAWTRHPNVRMALKKFNLFRDELMM